LTMKYLYISYMILIKEHNLDFEGIDLKELFDNINN
jgi:hypothetical protein